MKLAALGLVLLVGCVPPRPPALTTAEAQVAVIELALAVQIAAVLCEGASKHLNRFDVKRSEALFDRCTNALIPARDAVVFSKDVGCTARAVRLGLEGAQRAIADAGYIDRVPGIEKARSLEGHALETCDPLHPSTTTTTFIDPNIVNVSPGYP